MSALLDQWVGLFWRLGAPAEDASATGTALLDRWSASPRHYHDRRHLVAVLDAVTTLDGSDTVLMSAWWHDAIYDPRRDDNEQRSADLAAETLAGLGLDPAVITEVVRLVLLTIDHVTVESDVDGQVLCDADLGVLAGEPAVYDSYVADVRREYAFVDDTGWRAGRSTVLRQLLALPGLYRTPTGRTWESAARANLSRELAGLTDGAWPDADRLP